MGKGKKGPGGAKNTPPPSSQPAQSGGSSQTKSGLKIVRKPAAAKPLVVTIVVPPEEDKQPAAAPKKETPAAKPVEEVKKEPVAAAAKPVEQQKKGPKTWSEISLENGKKKETAVEQVKKEHSAPKPAEQPKKKGPMTWSDIGKSNEPEKVVEKANSPAAVAAAEAAPVKQLDGKKGKQLDDEVCTKAVIPTDAAPKSWRRVTLETNYFPIVLGSVVYEYGVTFNPSMGDSSKRRVLIRKHKIPSELMLVGNVLYCSAPVSEEDAEWTVSAREAGMSSDVTITLSLANTFKKGTEVPSRVFAALFQRALMTAGYKHIQRNFFDFNRVQTVPGGKYIVIPGVELAVVPAMCGPALVADVTNKVARTGTVLGMWRDSKRDKYEDSFCKKMEKAVVYTNYNNRSYTVKAVRRDLTPNSEFVLDDGTKISYAKYVERRYAKRVTTLDQPMLECERHGESLFIIPEFCQPTGFDDKDRRDFKLMSEITKKLFPEPQERQIVTAHEVDVIKSNTSKEVSLNVSSPTTVEGSIIQLPKLPEMKARVNLSRANANVMAGGKPLKRLAIVKSRRFDARTLGQCIIESLDAIGMKGIEPTEIEWNNRDISKVQQSLQTVRPDFVVFVSPFGDDRDYREMKMMCTHQLKVPSQVVTERNLNNPKRALTVTLNVVRQMAVKLGKRPWKLPFNDITKGTMVFGLDVCHTTSIHKSVVGIVATLDDTFGTFLSDFIVQDRGKEIVGDLKPFVKEAFEAYKKHNHAYPKNILFLRDGVGDGQLMYVNDVEMTAIHDAVKAISPNTRMTFVVVKKRIRTRLYNRGRNPEPGTLVDSVITHPNWYDFFLVSHETRNGTVSPTHYNVLLDDMKWPKSELQSFIYLLCYQYYNWDGSISVPAPCQYAHKMAFLYGKTLLSARGGIPSVPPELKETLLQI